ncbi:MAG TPA: YggT family protein [Armatimonadota bacterium]|jgi:uncharacterized protein YggT (Ycf19 family)
MNLVIYVLMRALDILVLIIFASIILSWVEFFQRSNPRSGFRLNMGNPVIRFIESVAYSVLHPIRRVIEPYQRSSGIDFSPIIALVLISVVRSVLLGLAVGR